MRKLSARARWAFFIVLVLCWVLMISERAAFPFVATVVIATVLAVWRGIDLVRNGGVRETQDGITNRRAFGYRH